MYVLLPAADEAGSTAVKHIAVRFGGSLLTNRRSIPASCHFLLPGTDLKA